MACSPCSRLHTRNTHRFRCSDAWPPAQLFPSCAQTKRARSASPAALCGSPLQPVPPGAIPMAAAFAAPGGAFGGFPGLPALPGLPSLGGPPPPDAAPLPELAPMPSLALAAPMPSVFASPPLDSLQATPGAGLGQPPALPPPLGAPYLPAPTGPGSPVSHTSGASCGGGCSGVPAAPCAVRVAPPPTGLPPLQMPPAPATSGPPQPLAAGGVARGAPAPPLSLLDVLLGCAPDDLLADAAALPRPSDDAHRDALLGPTGSGGPLSVPGDELLLRLSDDTGAPPAPCSSDGGSGGSGGAAFALPGGFSPAVASRQGANGGQEQGYGCGHMVPVEAVSPLSSRSQLGTSAFALGPPSLQAPLPAPPPLLAELAPLPPLQLHPLTASVHCAPPAGLLSALQQQWQLLTEGNRHLQQQLAALEQCAASGSVGSGQAGCPTCPTADVAHAGAAIALAGGCAMPATLPPLRQHALFGPGPGQDDWRGA